MNSLRKKVMGRGSAVLAVALICAELATADDMEMDMDMTGNIIKPSGPIHGESKTFHWLATVFLLLVLPSIAAAFTFAGKYGISSMLHIVSGVYSIFEALFLRFPDMKGHENRTSRGTAWFLMFFYAATVFVGLASKGSNLISSKSRMSHISEKTFSVIYKAFSVMITIAGFIKSCLAPVALFGFCYGSHTGQCNAHGIMGISFILYGFILLMVLVVPWFRIKQKGQTSQEMYDSTFMCVYGIVNTFTEHRWGREPWSHGDYQHTSMGIVWWAGGLLGIWLSRNGNRSFIPSLLLIFTGYSMSEHVQKLQISTKVHSMFGNVLILGGVSRIIEISFLLKDNFENPKIYPFQYIPAFALIESGILFMGATEEQLTLVKDLGADHSAYILVLTSAAFVVTFWLCLVLELYLRLVGHSSDSHLKLGDYESLPIGEDLNALDIDAHGSSRRAFQPINHDTTVDPESFELDDLSDTDGQLTPSDR